MHESHIRESVLPGRTFSNFRVPVSKFKLFALPLRRLAADETTILLLGGRSWSYYHTGDGVKGQYRVSLLGNAFLCKDFPIMS